MTTTPTPAQVLACPMVDDDSGVDGTVGDYLIALLAVLWAEDEGFSGKRPFGNSGWQNDVYTALRVGGVVGDDLVKLDEDGYVESCDYRPLDGLIIAAIRGATLR